jgi:acyl dehydratase
MAVSELRIDQQIPSVSKKVTQESINQLESCGILDRKNIHNSPELAKQRLGYDFPVASGRMSVAFAAESLRKFFGADVFNHSGTVNLKFLRPVKNGDTITVYGSVSHQEQTASGTLVTVRVYCENQDRDQTATGTGTGVVP